MGLKRLGGCYVEFSAEIYNKLVIMFVKINNLSQNLVNFGTIFRGRTKLEAH